MDETVHYLLMASHLRLQKQLLDRLKGTGLTLGQPKVLDYLRDHNGASQKAIAQACHMEPGSLSVILTRMEGQGLLRRQAAEGGPAHPARLPHPPRGPFGWSRSPRPFRSWRAKPSKASPGPAGCFPPDPAKGL